VANAMYLAGFDVKDVHMTDLISGRENLEDIQFIGIVVVSNSDVLGSAKVGQERFIQRKSNSCIENFFKREDTLSVGILTVASCFMELSLLMEHEVHGKMLHNDSHKHKVSLPQRYRKTNR
jgi:phosphoribosylformylglycinamidine synthase